MSFQFRIRLTCLTLLFFASLLMMTIPVQAAEGCFVERGRTQMVNITKVAVSGRLVTSVQRGSWDTRPTVRVAEIGSYGIIEVGNWKPVWNVADIALEAATAFVAADGGLFALDLTDPVNPIELSFIDLNDSQHLAVDSGRAFIATTGVSGNGWFDVVDISDPSTTQRIGGIFWPRPDLLKYAIDARGDTVVIADQNGLLVVNVNNAANPVEVGRWSHAEARDVALIGDHHAVVTFSAWAHPGEFGITVVDLSDPSDPTPVGSWTAPSEVLSVAEYGGAVVAGTESDGVFLIDIEDPVNPRRIDHFENIGLGPQDLATAWPSIAASNVDFGIGILGLHRSCQPPRRPSARVGP
jgi:hypothetical protein